jgi:hypothetical protein
MLGCTAGSEIQKRVERQSEGKPKQSLLPIGTMCLGL